MEALLASVSQLVDGRQFEEVGTALDEAELEVRKPGAAAITGGLLLFSSQSALPLDRRLTCRNQARCHRNSGRTRCICWPTSMPAACEPTQPTRPAVPLPTLLLNIFARCMEYESGPEGDRTAGSPSRLAMAPMSPAHRPPPCMPLHYRPCATPLARALTRREDARFLYKRTPEHIRQGSPELGAAFALLQRLWVKDYQTVWAELQVGCEESCGGLMNVLGSYSKKLQVCRLACYIRAQCGMTCWPIVRARCVQSRFIPPRNRSLHGARAWRRWRQRLQTAYAAASWRWWGEPMPPSACRSWPHCWAAQRRRRHRVRPPACLLGS